MTSHMGHTLPSDDAGFERCMDALDADGLEVRPDERAAFATIHEFGLLPRILPVVHRAMDMGSLSPSGAADARRLVRGLDENQARPTAHRAVFRAPENHVHETRLWELDDDGLGYTHRCGFHEGDFVDSRQTTEAAVAHGQVCEVRDDR